MQSVGRFLRIPVCTICRDQLYDFVWVSGVQAVVALAFSLGGLVFLVEIPDLLPGNPALGQWR